MTKNSSNIGQINLAKINEQKKYFLAIKRIFDICISLLLLIIIGPLFVVIAIIIRLESAGPIIYAQKRVGLLGGIFTLYKFRSMHYDAEKNGAVWASINDERITKCGRFMRKLRMDELPQLWNILKNDMSFIGPRPERVEFVNELKNNIENYNARHCVKPGLTGLAQVCYPYAASEEDARNKLKYDLYYINNMSLWLEVKILFKTVGVVLFPKGVR